MKTASTNPGRIALLLVLVGCGRVVLVADDGAGGGAGGDASSTGGSPESGGATGATNTTSSSGGGGGEAPLQPLTCALGADVFVTATGMGSSSAAHIENGVWQTLWFGPPAAAITAYTDPYQCFGALFNDTEGVTRVLQEVEPGLMLDSSTGFVAWPPIISPVGGPPGFVNIVLTQSPSGWRTAILDPDAFDWVPYTDVPDSADWDSIAPDWVNGRFTVVGRSGASVCYAVTDAAGVFSNLGCLPNITSPTSEIPNSPPRAIPLANSDTAVVYMPQASGALSVVVRYGEVWSTPFTIESPAIGVRFAAAPTPDGGIVAGVLSTSGELSFVRFEDGAWAGPFPIGSGYQGDAEIGAGPGNCGADAFIGVARGGVSVDVARVRGTQSAIETVLPFGDDFASNISFAIRHGNE